MIVDDGPRRGTLELRGAERFRSKLLAMPGAHGWKDDRFFCDSGRANVEFIERTFSGATWNSKRLEEIEELRRQEELLLQKPTTTSDYEYKTSPFGHQRDAFERSKDLADFAYLMEMGTGKTKVLIDVATYNFEKGAIEAVIMIAPNGVHRQFVNEQIPEHMPDRVREKTDVFVYQSGGDKVFQQRKAKFLVPKPGKLRILSINVEALSHKSGFDYCIEFLKSLGTPNTRRKCIIAVDESTRIKNHKSGRSVSVCKLGRYVTHRRIMSGSPVTRGVEDLFGQFLFLGEQLIGFRSFYTFRARYCILKDSDSRGAGGGGGNFKTVIGYQNIEELQARIRPWSHRVKKEDCLDLPPKVYVKREVELSKQQRDLYNELRKELLIEIQGRTLTAAMAAVRMTKLQQILCGHVRINDGGELIILPDIPRIQLLKDLVDEAPGQVIVWARFTPDIDRICNELAHLGVSRYDGRVPNDQREISKNRFKDGTNRIFMGQPASAGLGLNLVGPETVIYYSNSFDAEHRWQSEDRNHRAGTRKSVTYYDLVAPKSIDGYILANLAKKKDVASMTIDEMGDMLKEEI